MYLEGIEDGSNLFSMCSLWNYDIETLIKDINMKEIKFRTFKSTSP